MEIWPKDNPLLRLKQAGWAVVFLLFLSLAVLSKIIDESHVLSYQYGFSIVKFFVISLIGVALIALLVLSHAAESKFRQTKYMLAMYMLLPFAGCIYAVLLVINAKFDNSPTIVIDAVVIQKESPLKSSAQFLILKTSNKPKGNLVISVKRNFYNTVKISDKVQLSVHQGKLQFPWVSEYKKID